MGRVQEFKKKLNEYQKSHDETQTTTDRRTAFSEALNKKASDAAGGLGRTEYHDNQQRSRDHARNMELSEERRQWYDKYSNLNVDTAAAAQRAAEAGRKDTQEEIAHLLQKMNTYAASGMEAEHAEARKRLEYLQGIEKENSANLQQLRQDIATAKRLQAQEKYAKVQAEATANGKQYGADTSWSTEEIDQQIRKLDEQLQILTASNRNEEADALKVELDNLYKLRSMGQYGQDEERTTYSYLKAQDAKTGGSEAQAYLNFMQETMNYRKGMEQVSDIRSIDNDVLRTLAMGAHSVGAGMANAGAGYNQLLSKDPVPTPAMQYASQELMGSMGVVGQTLYSAGTTVGNMLPTILLSVGLGAAGVPGAVAGGVASTAMGASVAGNTYTQAVKEGYAPDQAKTYAALVGASEAALQYLLGGIGAMGGITDDVILAKVKTIDNALARIALTGAVKIGSEVGEEELQLFLEPAIKSIVFGEGYNPPKWEEIIETAIVTALSTGVLEGPATIGAGFDSSQVRSAAADMLTGKTAEAPKAPQTAQETPKAQAENVTAQEAKPAQVQAQTAMAVEAEQQTQERAAWNQAAAKAFGETGQKAFQTMNDGSMDAAELYAGFAVYHKAGMDGKDIQSVKSEYAKTFPENFRKIAYDAGVADATQAKNTAQGIENQVVQTYTDSENKTEVPNYGEGVHLRNSGQWAGSQNPGGQVSAVETGTGRDQSRQTEAAAADIGAAALSYGEKVSTASLGIPGGSTNANIRIVTGGETAATRAAMNTAKANGLQLTLFVGGNLEIGNVSGKMDSVRAYISGNKVFVRADHPTYTADQLMRHETGHARIARGEIDPEEVKNRIVEKYGDENTGHLADLYAAAYEGSGLDADAIWEEVICDSLGDMNIFQEIETISKDVDGMLHDVKESAEAEAQAARGPPAEDTNVPGKMSRDNGRRAQRGRSIEMETMENNRFQRLRQFKGDLPAEWYAFTGDYFYIYSNQSYTDYTLLAKVKITEKNRPHINEFKERIDNGTYTGAEAFDRWTEDFRRGKGRDSWHHAGTGKTGAAGRNDGVDVRKQGSKHSGNSAEGSGADEVTGKASRELDSLEELRKQNLELQKQVEYWKGQTKVTTRETATLRQGDIDKLARRIVKDYSSTMKAGDIAGPLKTLGEYILRDGDGRNELTWPAVKEKAVDIARDVVQSAEVLQDDAWRQYSDLRQYLKNTEIIFGKQYQSEIPDYSDFRRRNARQLKFGKGDGTNVDRIYKELAEQWPWLFNEEAVSHPADQLLQIEDVLESLKPIYENPFSYHMAEATEYLANEIIDSLLGESIRQSPKTFADKQAAKQDKLRGDAAQAVAAAKQETKTVKADAKQALKAAKQDAAQAIKEARQEAFLAGQMRQGQKMAEVMRKEAAARDKKLADLKKHYAEAADRKKARAADSKARTRLLNIAKRLQNKKLPAVTRDLLNQYIGELDTVAKSMTSTSLEKLYDLRDWYDDQKANNPDFIADPRIEKILQRLYKKQIKDLSAKEVADLTEVLLGIENQIRTQDKLINSEEKRRIYSMGVQVITDVENTKGSKTGVLGIPSKYVVTETLSPIRMIRRMTGYVDNDPLYTVANELADGQRKQMDFQRRAGDLFKKWVNDKKFSQSIAGEKAHLVKITGIGEDGKAETVQITPAMRMSLYLHSLNSQNMRHVADGGVTIPDMNLYKKGKIAEAYSRSTTIRLTPSMVRGITQGMTAQERAFAQAAYRYFNGMSQTEINEVSEQLNGYSLAQVENYFPINTDSSFTRKDFEALKFDGTIEGMGFLKERTNSSVPILLRDMNSVLTQSIDMTSKYVGLAIPVRNFNKVWGVTKASYDNSGKRTRYESSVQKAVKQMWGSDGYDYIENMMTDLNTGRPAAKKWEKVMNKIKGNYAGAVLTLNPGVALKQYGAWFSAGSVLGFKPLVKGAFHKKIDVNLINRYTPLLWYRSQGFSTQELGDMAKNDMRLPKWLDWLSGTDVQITTSLWKAAEHYVRANNKDLKFGTDAFYKAVAEVYNRTIEETQPNYTTMQRPQLLRSENTLMQNLSMFKTDAFQSFNVLYDAMGNLHAKKKAATNSKTPEAKEAYRQAKINAGRAVSAQFMQLALVAGVQVVWNLIRGKREKYEDEEDKITFGSVAGEVGKDMLGGVASFVPFGSDIWELVSSKLFDETYYGMDTVTVQALVDAATSISGLTDLFSGMAKSLVKGEPVDWNETRLAADNYFDDFSKALGIPYENVVNAFNAAYLNGAKWMKGKYLGTYAALQLTTGYDSGTGEYYDLLWKTLKAADMDAYHTISKDLQEHIEQYNMSGESITSAMRSRYNKAVKENPDFKLPQRAADIIGVRGKYAADEADDSFGVDNLGAEAYQKYINEQADTYRSVADKIQGYDSFAGMDAEVKDKLLAAADKLAKQTALENASDGEYAVDTKWIDWAQNGEKAGVDEAEAILFKVAYDMAVSDHDRDGKVISGSKKENTLEQAKEWMPGLTQRELDYLMSNYWSNKK